MSLAVVLGLAKHIPNVLGLFDKKRGKKAQEAVTAVLGVAEKLTGKKGDAAVDAINADPNLAMELQLAVMADSHVSEQLQAEEMESARSSYKVHHDQADRVAENIMKRNLPTIFMLVLCNIAAVMSAKYWQLPGEVLAIISNLIGVVIGQLLSERQSVVGFFFGSSLGSKMKNK